MNPSHDPERTQKDEVKEEMKVERNEDVLYVTIPKGERFPTRVVVQRDFPFDPYKEFFYPKR